MNRKHFLNTIGILAAGVNIPFQNELKLPKEDIPIYKRPPYLKRGDTIGITSSAGFITIEEIQPAKQLMENWGFKVMVGATIGKRDYSFGGTDAERAGDLQAMLDDREIKAIMCARGGYGMVRIVDALNWTAFRQRPKWFIGFSDATVLHSHIHTNCMIATLHSKMTNSFPDDWTKAEPIEVDTINSIHDALTGRRMTYSVIANAYNKMGVAEGILVGGNLKLLETLSGTKSDISTTGKILFIEDTGEYLYSIDRMLWHLQRTGKLKGLKGLIVGGFKVKPDDEGEEFGRTVNDIVLQRVKDFNYPVCFDFPVGHQRANFALKCGVKHQLTVKPTHVMLSEIL